MSLIDLAREGDFFILNRLLNLFSSLYAAFAQSLASENAARLAAMQAAELKIRELEETLQSRFRETRQNTITADLLDFVSGLKALTTG